MRTFVALNLSPERRAVVHAATEPLRELLGRAVAWVAEPALHVTLRFLGERPDQFVARLVDSLRESVQRRRACVVELEGVGAFPSLARPRVLWVGISSNPVLAELYQEVDAACTSLGVPREERAFHPHVTIGRVRDGVRVDGRALERAAAAVQLRETERVSTVDVMESQLGAGGARYRVAAVIPFDSGEREG